MLQYWDDYSSYEVAKWEHSFVVFSSYLFFLCPQFLLDYFENLSYLFQFFGKKLIALKFKYSHAHPSVEAWSLELLWPRESGARLGGISSIKKPQKIMTVHSFGLHDFDIFHARYIFYLIVGVDMKMYYMCVLWQVYPWKVMKLSWQTWT